MNLTYEIIRLTGLDLQKRPEYSEISEVQSIKFSNNYVNCFMKRNNLKYGPDRGCAKWVPEEDVKAEKERLRAILQNYKPEDTWNFDETMFQHSMLGSYGIKPPNAQGRSLKGNQKEGITLGLYLNRLGEPCYRQRSAISS